MWLETDDLRNISASLGLQLDGTRDELVKGIINSLLEDWSKDEFVSEVKRVMSSRNKMIVSDDDRLDNVLMLASSRWGKSLSHEVLVSLVSRFLPIILKRKFWLEDIRSYEVKLKTILLGHKMKREADIILFKDRVPSIIIEVERPLPFDPFLRQIRVDSIGRELRFFLTIVRKVFVVTLYRDNELSLICDSMAVRYCYLV
jgi:hypothetical protein